MKLLITSPRREGGKEREKAEKREKEERRYTKTSVEVIRRMPVFDKKPEI